MALENCDGWINLIKPVGVSSSSALNFLRKLFKGIKKVGHIGTLDPFASGVLPVAIGEATKTIEYISNTKKVYIAKIEWGFETNTLDSTGSIIKRCDDGFRIPSLLDLESVLGEFTGEISQIPPKFSANKIAGKRAYSLARADIEFELKPKKVKCFSIKILNHDTANCITELEICCGSGFYIRSFARDLAARFSLFATVFALCRIRDGIFCDKDGITLALLKKVLYDDIQALQSRIVPLTSVLDDIPVLEVSAADGLRLKNGLSILVGSGFRPGSLLRAQFKGIVVAICRVLCAPEVYDAQADGLVYQLAIKPLKGFNLIEFNDIN